MTTRNIFAGGAPDGGPLPPAEGDSSGGEGTAAAKVIKIRARVDIACDMDCARMPLTDLGNAERWRLRYGDDFRFCPEIGWFAWDGRRWELLSEERDKIPARVMQSVFLTVRAIRNEAALIAATGGLEGFSVRDSNYPQLLEWARGAQLDGRNDYLRACPVDEREALGLWLDGLDEQDFVVDFAKRKAWSTSIAAWAKTSEGSGKLKSVADLAKSFESINITPTAMDADRMAINVLNGTLRMRLVVDPQAPASPSGDLASSLPGGAQSRAVESDGSIPAPDRERSEGKGDRPPAGAAQPAGRSDQHRGEARGGAPHHKWIIELHPHRRDDLISKLAPVEYNPRKQCAAYDQFLARVQPDEHMRRFIHQWGGLSLTGDIGEHKLAFFYGGGRNGKGTWVELVAAIAGDYAGSVQFESLADTGAKRRGDQATPDLAELPGVRLLRVAEPSAGVKFDDGLLKQLTGGDPVKARYLNKGFFEFLPSFKITISGNNKPNVRDTSHGFWARMQLVPWAETIPEDEIDHRLPEKLREQASGVLNRLLAGLLDWRTHGLIVPDEVRMATHAYRDQSDDLGRFLAQCCVVSDGDDRLRVGARELYDVFEAWADQVGGGNWSIKGFKKAMEDRGFVQKPSNGMKWLRVALRDGVTAEGVKAGNLPDLPVASSSEAVGRQGSSPEAAGGPSGGVGGDAGQGAGDEPVPGWDD